MLAHSRDDYQRLAAGGGPIPLRKTVLADMETPLSAYWKLCQDETHSFLLESVTGGDQLARFSIIGVRPRKVVRARGSQVREFSHGRTTHRTLSDHEDPLALVFNEVGQIREELLHGLPRLCGGAVGLIGYDYVRKIERLPCAAQDDLEIDDVAMMLMESVVVFDHVKNEIILIALADGTEAGYVDAEAEIERLLVRLKAPLPALPRQRGPAPEFKQNVDQAEYESMVERAIAYIKAGDAFQVVPSLRNEAAVTAHPLTIYRALRSLNPSPYMFLFRFGDFDVVGASPELLVGLSHGEARVRPIAGTRPRSADPEEDIRLGEELLADEKERAEHIMLVDLGRNDLGRVCDYGTVNVHDLMVIERYSHVMHIVSSVTGKLRDGVSATDLVRASFPAGTVSGAPKVRAMEIIDELEPTRRGLYAGSVGYFSATGDLDLAIAIRTTLLKNGKAYIQAGAGIVFDSNPTSEYKECLSKASAVMRAIEIAQKGLED
jgi:anthranilate synthase component 1